MLVARVPLFMFQAIQAALLPKLARLAAQGRFDDFRQGFRRLMMVVVAVGLGGVVLAFTIGPLVLDIVFNAEIGRRTLTLLALGSAMYMVALGIAQAVIALHGHAWVAVGLVVRPGHLHRGHRGGQPRPPAAGGARAGGRLGGRHGHLRRRAAPEAAQRRRAGHARRSSMPSPTIRSRPPEPGVR